MGNLSKGVSSESSKVGARCPPRNSLAYAQSLNLSPASSNGVRNLGMAKAPNATSGVNFSSSRRFMARNLRLSVCKLIRYTPPRLRSEDRIQEQQSSYTDPFSPRLGLPEPPPTRIRHSCAIDSGTLVRTAYYQ